MDNITLEMKKIVDEARDNNLPDILIRNQLKEFLHYFVLDCIYNSRFKDLIFYGGSCLRILYDLPRMSEDLDFEAEKNIDFANLSKGLEDYFRKDLRLTKKFSSKKEKGINRIFLNFPIMHDIGLSSHKEETLRIKVEIRPEPKNYFKNLNPVFTPKSKYGKSFVIKHYDLPTLFASKLAAILNRPKKGFFAGSPKEKINFKGRDFYDLIWYMEKGVLPNEEMLRTNGVKESVGDVFDEIILFMSQTNLISGLKKDLEALFVSQNYVGNFTNTFRQIFQNLKKERYTAKRVKELEKIIVDAEFVGMETDVKAAVANIYIFKFDYPCENEMRVFFLFRLSDYFINFREGDIDVQLTSEAVDKIDFRTSIGDNIRLKKYVALFLPKINEYLKRHHNEVYFSRWESKLIRMADDNFNPGKEIVFSSGQDLADKKAILEILSL